jgi:hypothetical protein
MDTFYVTYKQSGIPKKGKIDDNRYMQLKEDKTVVDLVAYPTELIMENNYVALTNSKGLPGTKNILRG